MKRLILMVLCFIFSIVANAKMYGVFYGKNGNGLSCPENDVTDLAKLYRANKGQVILIRGNGVTRNNVLGALRDQTKACTADDIFMFVYSGHGDDGYIECGNNDIKFTEIKRILSTCLAKRKVVIIDACYSGSFSDTRHGVIDGDNVIVITSSRSSEESVEFRERNSPFFNAIITGLKGEADTNLDGKVVTKELFSYIANNTKKYGLDQHPTMKGKFNENIILYTYNKNNKGYTHVDLGIKDKKKDKLPIELSYEISFKSQTVDNEITMDDIRDGFSVAIFCYVLSLFTIGFSIFVFGIISVIIAHILVRYKRKHGL